jgi:regulator of replication initiation timing
MKNVLNIFSRPGAERMKQASVPGFREPTLYSGQPSPRPAPAARQAPQRASQPKAPEDMLDIPFDYPGIVKFFQKTVSDRRSPFNSLVQAADRLQEFIPDEISRLKAAYALCGEQWSPEVLALAIHNHIADIDNVCAKAKSSKGMHAGEQARQMRAECVELTRQNATLQTEIDTLKARLEEVQTRFDANGAKIMELGQQAQLIESDASSASFLEQAAENLKNDLLAKKVLLGLT